MCFAFLPGLDSNTGTGLPTKGGAARVCIVLAQECPKAYTAAIAGRLVSGLLALLQDGSAVIRVEAAKAGAAVAAIASEAQRKRWVQKGLALAGVLPDATVADEQIEGGEDTYTTVAAVVLEFLKHSNNRSDEVLSIVVPPTFLVSSMMTLRSLTVGSIDIDSLVFFSLSLLIPSQGGYAAAGETLGNSA